MFFIRPQTVGRLDVANSTRISGWAAPARKRESKRVVEILVDGQVRGAAAAAEFREDLAQAGYGDGRFAFSIDTRTLGLSSGPHEISARIAGADTELAGSPVTIEIPEQLPYKFEYFAGDIVDNCNLRCPFCLVDYTNIRTTNKMEDETFRRWIEIMPLVQDGSFYISCLHEPTLHPRLYEFIEMIPEDLRKKVFFTTNLCRPMKDHQIETLAKSGLDHINISMDSLDDVLFAELRKGGKLKIFRDNLERFVAATKESDRAPDLRYISMAYKTNLDELPGMVETTFERFNASRHEVRYTYNVRHIAQEFRDKHFLAREDWIGLERTLNALPYEIDLDLPPDDYEKAHVRSVNYWVMPDEEGFPATIPDSPMALRGAWSGEIRIRKREEHFSVNVNVLRDPRGFFEAL